MVTPTPDELTRELLIAFRAVIGASQTQLRETLDRLGLTVPLADALWVLDPAQPAPSMKTLAGQLHCDPSSATFLVTRLELQGLTERVPDPADRRSKTVELTDKGALVRGELIEAMVAQSPLAALGPEDQAAALQLLRRALAQAERP
ncbi:MarR family winged helix-turn-helix transcriptional regulator [Streptomyces chattanoogensis]|uniref:MarR family winged helix-turn-helix transcriptional regulator n=1 Tax=Streptomyces chattanoogensis TaxID=66876 RepID=UPI0006B5C968|nr:MarR family winged helix-turn-helix transcriptional regulator [Streptomyces chattanoogensis]